MFFLSLTPCLPLLVVVIHLAFRHNIVPFQYLGHAGGNILKRQVGDGGQIDKRIADTAEIPVRLLIFTN